MIRNNAVAWRLLQSDAKAAGVVTRQAEILEVANWICHRPVSCGVTDGE
jgi:hypothetical protein